LKGVAADFGYSNDSVICLLFYWVGVFLFFENKKNVMDQGCRDKEG